MRTENDLKESLVQTKTKLDFAEKLVSEKDMALSNYQQDLAKGDAAVLSLKRDLASMQQRASTMAASNLELQQQLRDLENGENSHNKSVQDRLVEENQELKRTIESLENQIKDNEDELIAFTDQILQKENECNDMAQQAQANTISFESQQRQLESFKSQVTELKRTSQALQDKAILVENMRSKLQLDLAASKKQSSESLEKMTALEKSLSHVRALLSEEQTAHKADVQAVSLAREADQRNAAKRLETIEAQLQDQIALHERSLQEANETQLALKQNLSDCQAQIESMESTIKQFSNRTPAKTEEQNALKGTLASERARHEQAAQTAAQRIAELETARTVLKSQAELKIAELQQSQKLLRELQTSNKEHNREIDTLRSELKTLEQNSAELKHARDSLESKNSGLTFEAEQFASKISMLHGTIETLRREHQAQLLKKADELFAKGEQTETLADRLSTMEANELRHVQEIERLDLALNSADQRLIAQESQLQELLGERDQLQAKVDSTTPTGDLNPNTVTETAHVQREFDLARKRLENLELELKEITAERDLLYDQLHEATEAHVRQQDESAMILRSLRDELALLKAESSKEIARYSQAETQHAEIVREQQSLASREQIRLNQLVKQLEESLELTKKNHASLLESVGGDQTATIGNQQIVEDLEAEVDRLTQANQDLQKAVDTSNRANSIIDGLEAELVELEEQLEETRKNAENQTRQAEERLQTSQEHYESAIKLNNEEKITLQRDLADAQLKMDELQKQVKDRSMHKASVTRNDKLDMRATHQQSNKSSEAELDRERKSNARLTEDLKRAARNVKKLEGEIEVRERKLSDFKELLHQKGEQNSSLEQRFKALAHQTKDSERYHAKAKQTIARQQAAYNREVAGVDSMLRYLRARLDREERFRENLAYMKSYVDKKIASFQACNQANLIIIQQIGIAPPVGLKKRATFKAAAKLVIAVVRMRRSAKQWSLCKIEKDKIDKAIRQR